MRVQDLDLTKGLMSVVGKGRKGRIVPMPHELCAAILSYSAVRPLNLPSLWLAAGAWGHGCTGPLGFWGLRQVLRRRCARAGARYRHPHAWRHGFAVTFLNAGMDMSAVAAVMGHASEKTTEAVYAKWLISGLQRVYREVAERVAMGK
jgi:integrase